MQQPHNPERIPHHTTARIKDPGSTRSRLLAVLATIVGIVVVLGWQNLDETAQFALFGATPPQTPIDTQTPAPGALGPSDIMARLYIRGRSLLVSQDEELARSVVGYVDMTAASREDRVRAIIMSAEFVGADEALARIGTLRDEILAQRRDEDADGGPFAEDPATTLLLDELDALQRLYSHGRGALEQPMHDQLEARYGVLGRAATTHGLDDTHPDRAPAVTGFWTIALFFLAVGALALLAPVVGLVILIFGIVSFTNRRGGLMRFRAPAPGGSVYLETYAVFLLGFGVLAIGTTALAALADPALAIVSLPLQWVLLLVPLWALARGTPNRSWRDALGLHRGAGIVREVWAGVLAYIACVPLYYASVVFTAVLVVIAESIRAASNPSADPEPLPANPILEIIARGDALILVILFTLATVWAPIVEELIFRGALHRHLRARTHWIGAALISAVLFAFMHSYGALFVAPLITLGFAFSFVREWRGSIIAPITMHFVHNATLMTIMIVLVNLISDPF